MNGTAVGDDIGNRDGRQITNKLLQLDFDIQTLYVNNKNSPTHRWRCDVVWDKSPNSAGLPSILDIFTSYDALAYTNLSNRNRFQILASRWGISNPLTRWTDAGTAYIVANSPGQFTKSLVVPLGNRITTYSGTTNAAASIATGMLIVVFRCANGASDASTNRDLSYEFNSRFRWVG